MSECLFVVIGDDGLNGPYVEAVSREPVKPREVYEAAQEAQMRGERSMPHNGYQVWRVDLETLEYVEVPWDEPRSA